EYLRHTVSSTRAYSTANSVLAFVNLILKYSQTLNEIIIYINKVIINGSFNGFFAHKKTCTLAGFFIIG
ncbi:hypothetical protein TA05_09165, partial [Citrobacter rodentium]